MKFETISKEFIRSINFLAILLEKYLMFLDKILFNLFRKGPIHRDIIYTKAKFGTKPNFSPMNLILPYKSYSKKVHTEDTILNIMLFQTVYYILIEANLIKEVLIVNKNGKKIRRLDKIIDTSIKLLDRYHLWYFYDIEFLREEEIISALISQQNPEYFKVFEIFKKVREMIFSKIILSILRPKIIFPIINFEYIYELWAIYSVTKYFEKKGYKIKKIGASFPNKHKYHQKEVKMVFVLQNKKEDSIEILWEIKFDPLIDSNYFGSLLRKTKGNKSGINIKPDIVIIIENFDKKICILGDVKFSMNENINLPKLNDLYKVIGYVVDLKKSEIFKDSKIEGILIFPGYIDPIKIPIPYIEKDTTNFFYINIFPLNYENNDPKLKELEKD